jgi:hypothetical protein
MIESAGEPEMGRKEEPEMGRYGAFFPILRFSDSALPMV